MTLSDSDKRAIVKQAREEYKANLMFRHQREASWKEGEDHYFNRKKKSLKGRYNVPIPIVPGFIDTWKSKINKTEIEIESGDEADYKAVLKVNAHLIQQQNFGDYDWDMIEEDGKTQAGLYGRVINKYFARSKPAYESNYEMVDVYDFAPSAFGGSNLEKHLNLYQDNIFKGKEDLKAGVESMGYDPKAVSDIINATKEDTLVDNDTTFKSKQNRLISLGLDGHSYNYTGQSLYKFIEGGTTYKGQRIYVLFNYELGIGIKVVPLKEVFESNLWPWTSWATHRDPFNFWSKSPVDDIIPVAEMIRILFNQELDNRLKRNFGMRAFDPAIFPNPAELVWKPDGLVAVKSGSSQVQQIGNAVYEFETAELNGTINLTQYMDNLLKEKTGINSEAQGESKQDKVGIAYLNLQQSGARTKEVNDAFNKNKKAIVRRYVWGLWEHMRNPQSVRIIGEKGAYWEELARREVNPDWNIVVKDGSAAMEADEIKKKAMADIMAGLTEDELAVTSPRWRVETKLRAIGVDEDEIRMAFDLQDEGSREVLAQASQMIQDCLNGKPYKVYHGANTAFVQKIIDYANENPDLPMKEFEKLMELAQAHIPIAQENMTRKAVLNAANKGIPPTQLSAGQPQDPSATEQYAGMDQPAAGTPEGTASQSQQISNQVRPEMPQPMTGAL